MGFRKLYSRIIAGGVFERVLQETVWSDFCGILLWESLAEDFLQETFMGEFCRRVLRAVLSE